MFYKYRKMSIVNMILLMIINFVEKDSFEASVKKIQFTFSIDSIFVYEKSRKSRLESICPLGNGDYLDDNSYLNEKSYIADFSEDGIEVINNINFFERKAKKDGGKRLEKMGINQSSTSNCWRQK